MRNWNLLLALSVIRPKSSFLLYLWGIETRQEPMMTLLIQWFLLYLWGIETRSKSSTAQRNNKFLLYLWGIETWMKLRAYPYVKSIFTLPMRNWNKFKIAFQTGNPACHFYSTYEELKRWITRRNSSGEYWFLLYLWGIETRWMDKRAHKARCIFTLPMRNWNGA